MADALRGIDELISSERTASIFQGVDELVNSPELQASLVNLNRALISFEAAMSTTRAFVEDADGQLEPIAEHVMKASRGLEDALTDTRSILLDVRNSISEDSRLRTVTNRAMEELEAAARSIRILADYLERHPESLIKGKPNPGGDR
jgi:paraquat-inducible protein B